MELLPTIAAPGVAERADASADAACHLYDAVVPWGGGEPGGWSRSAAEDAAETIETTAHALAYIHPRAEVILAPVHAALADLRRQLELAPADPLSADEVPATPRTVGNPRRTRWVRVPTPGVPAQPVPPGVTPSGPRRQPSGTAS
ncbi:hypothetical protein OOK31_01970 [Streptomyces sp. NBC_00249]|uniref:hypothetical protein n=1 Tax=Streptomyces sp. NBC_00249 TaxID=2975690 RepID=UPI002252DF72|nr:hypothetical protein [Streptomyces sp. NBC_00249]MCX5192669.1 hypothetical protein [Streptomyces sp. NBC_00249]